jgi:hypothetical protein
MPYDIPRRSLTVLERTVNWDMADEYLDVRDEFGPCTRFSHSQEISVGHPLRMPEGFYPGRGRVSAETA